MLKFLKDLVRSSVQPDKASHTKFWSNVGMFSMTIIFLHYGFKESLPEWYMWVYASAVAAPQLLSKLISLRWGIAPTEDKTKSPE
jgi:hypothetical protein